MAPNGGFSGASSAHFAAPKPMSKDRDPPAYQTLRLVASGCVAQPPPEESAVERHFFTVVGDGLTWVNDPPGGPWASPCGVTVGIDNGRRTSRHGQDDVMEGRFSGLRRAASACYPNYLY